eukprot:4124538-Amphidinium_carterae.1
MVVMSMVMMFVMSMLSFSGPQSPPLRCLQHCAICWLPSLPQSLPTETVSSNSQPTNSIHEGHSLVMMCTLGVDRDLLTLLLTVPMTQDAPIYSITSLVGVSSACSFVSMV